VEDPRKADLASIVAEFDRRLLQGTVPEVRRFLERFPALREHAGPLLDDLLTLRGAVIRSRRPPRRAPPRLDPP